MRHRMLTPAVASIAALALTAAAAAQSRPKAGWLSDGYDKERTSFDFRKIDKRRERLVCL